MPNLECCRTWFDLNPKLLKNGLAKESPLNDDNWKVYSLVQCPNCGSEVKDVTYIKLKPGYGLFEDHRYWDEGLDKTFNSIKWKKSAKKLLEKLDLTPKEAYLNYFIDENWAGHRVGISRLFALPSSPQAGFIPTYEFEIDHRYVFPSKRGIEHLNFLDKLVWKRFIKVNIIGDGTLQDSKWANTYQKFAEKL